MKHHTTHFDSCGCEKEKAKSEVFDAVLEKLRSVEAMDVQQLNSGRLMTPDQWANYIETKRSSILGTDEGDETKICRACNGSGEGYYTTNDKCLACGGKGIGKE